MFGEKGIYGTSINTKDKRKRVLMPVFTYAEEDDELLILDCKEYYEVISKKDFSARISILQEKYENSIKKNERDNIQKIKFEECEKIVSVVKVEKNGKISIEHLNLPDKIKITGIFKGVMLESAEEDSKIKIK